jgi:hypothetical protein
MHKFLEKVELLKCYYLSSKTQETYQHLNDKNSSNSKVHIINQNAQRNLEHCYITYIYNYKNVNIYDILPSL